jgi:TrmH family RNA methyltransferase
VIDSPKNARVKSLLTRIDSAELFVLEGEKFIIDAAGAGFEFEEVFHDSTFHAGRLAALSKHRPTEVSRAVLERFCEASHPQHAVAVARSRSFSAAEIAALSGPVVYLESVQDPGNLGAVARSLEAFSGAGLLASPGCAGIFHPRALRASAGSLLRLPAASGVTLRETAKVAADSRRAICGAVGSGGENLFRSKLSKKSLWLFGSEGAGLSAEALRILDRSFTIPLEPPVESLNVAVAAGIVLAELQRPFPPGA